MKTILIVDDEEKLRNILSKILIQQGFRIFSVSDAVSANKLLIKEKIDLILLDINMPEVKGMVFYEIIQAFHKNTKVVVSSVLPLDEQRRMIENAADYYDKSESLGVLLAKIKQVLRETPSKRILIIDDDSYIRNLYNKLLTRAGYISVETPDDYQLYKLLAEKMKDFDLVILDIAMPKISGLEFFEIIRNECPGVKVIVSSVFSEEQQRYFIFNADDYFDKSEGNQILLNKVKQLIGT